MNSKIFMSVIVPICILIPLITGAIKYHSLPHIGKLVVWYLVAGAITNTVVTITGRVFHVNNLVFSHIYTFIETAIIFNIYLHLLEIKKHKYILAFFISGFGILCIINALFFQSIFTYSSYTRSLEAIVCMFLALNYFAKLAAEEKPTLKMANFYFNTGVFLYFSGAFMLFIFSNFSITQLSMPDHLTIWVIHASLLLLLYLLFTYGLLLCKK